MDLSGTFELLKKKRSNLMTNLKLCVETRNEFVKLLPEDMHKSEENWFEAIDEVVFTQKQNIRLDERR